MSRVLKYVQPSHNSPGLQISSSLSSIMMDTDFTALISNAPLANWGVSKFLAPPFLTCYEAESLTAHVKRKLAYRSPDNPTGSPQVLKYHINVLIFVVSNATCQRY